MKIIRAEAGLLVLPEAKAFSFRFVPFDPVPGSYGPGAQILFLILFQIYPRWRGYSPTYCGNSSYPQEVYVIPISPFLFSAQPFLTRLGTACRLFAADDKKFVLSKKSNGSLTFYHAKTLFFHGFLRWLEKRKNKGIFIYLFNYSLLGFFRQASPFGIPCLLCIYCLFILGIFLYFTQNFKGHTDLLLKVLLLVIVPFFRIKIGFRVKIGTGITGPILFGVIWKYPLAFKKWGEGSIHEKPEM